MSGNGIFDNLIKFLGEASDSKSPETVPAPHGSCKAANTKRTSDGYYFVYSSSSGDRINVKAGHLSCSSHIYKDDHEYAGINLYSHEGKNDWRYSNDTLSDWLHCNPRHRLSRSE